MKVKKRKINIIFSILGIIIIGVCIGLFVYTNGNISKTDKIANIEKLIENKNYEKAYKLNNKYFLLSKKNKRNIKNKIHIKKEEEYIKNRDIISNIYSEVYEVISINGRYEVLEDGSFKLTDGDNYRQRLELINNVGEKLSKLNLNGYNEDSKQVQKYAINIIENTAHLVKYEYEERFNKNPNEYELNNNLNEQKENFINLSKIYFKYN